jgi:hypothetical protein
MSAETRRIRCPRYGRHIFGSVRSESEARTDRSRDWAPGRIEGRQEHQSEEARGGEAEYGEGSENKVGGAQESSRVSNVRYYERREMGLCPQCGRDPEGRVYCLDCRERHRERRIQERTADREGYNQYMRVWKSMR